MLCHSNYTKNNDLSSLSGLHGVMKLDRHPGVFGIFIFSSIKNAAGRSPETLDTLDNGHKKTRRMTE